MPNPEIVNASSHGIANTSSHSEPNAILPRVETRSVPANKRANPPLRKRRGFDGIRVFRTAARHCPAPKPPITKFKVTIQDVIGGTTTYRTNDGSDAVEMTVYFDQTSGTFKVIMYTYK